MSENLDLKFRGEELPKKRRVVTWNATESISLCEQPLPQIGVGELLIKVMACSICGSDLRIFKHGNERVKPGQIIGHEISGVVVAVGKGTNFSIGDKVSVGADVPCQNCVFCKSGNPNCCRENLAIGHQYEGGFSEYLHINQLTALHGPIKIFKSDISFSEAALAEPLACCINGYERCGEGDFESVVIFGAGPIGLMLAMLAKNYGASLVTVADKNRQRLKFATDVGACDAVIDSNNCDPVEQVMAATNGKGVDRVFTACPDSQTHAQAVEMIGVRGVINLFGGLPAHATQISLNSNRIHYNEATITGSHGSTPRQHEKALAMIESGKVPVKLLVTNEFSLSEINEAYHYAASGDGVKVVVRPHLGRD